MTIDTRAARADRKRKAAERLARRRQGLVRRDVYAHPDDWPQIKRLEADLLEKRLGRVRAGS